MNSLAIKSVSFVKSIPRKMLNVVKNAYVYTKYGILDLIREHTGHLPYPPGYQIPKEVSWREHITEHIIPGIKDYIELKKHYKWQPYIFHMWKTIDLDEIREIQRKEKEAKEKQEIEQSQSTQVKEEAPIDKEKARDTVQYLTKLINERLEAGREGLYQFIKGYNEGLGRDVKIERKSTQFSGKIDENAFYASVENFAKTSKKWKDEMSTLTKVTDEDLKK